MDGLPCYGLGGSGYMKQNWLSSIPGGWEKMSMSTSSQAEGAAGQPQHPLDSQLSLPTLTSGHSFGFDTVLKHVLAAR